MITQLIKTLSKNVKDFISELQNIYLSLHIEELFHTHPELKKKSYVLEHVPLTILTQLERVLLFTLALRP